MTTTTSRTLGLGRRSWLALSGLLLAEAMNLLDGTITTVVAPIVTDSLGGGAAGAQWILAAYTLPFAILLILGGRLGDMFGRRRVFIIGLLGFLVASTGCAAAISMPMILTARAVQGGFAALVIPQTIGLIKAMFAGPALPRALSFIGPVMGITAVAGPALGGVLTSANVGGLSWRAVFLVNLPLGLLVLAASPLLKEDAAPRRPTLDVTGLFLAAVAGAGFVVPTIEGSGQGWPTWTWGCFAGAIIGSVALGFHIRRSGRLHRDAIIEPSLFRDRGFPAALVTSVLYFGISTVVVFIVVLYLEGGLGVDVLAASLTVLPFSAGLAISSLSAGQVLVPRFGPRVMYPGILILAAGLAVSLAAVLLSSGAYSVCLPVGLGIAGLGGGLVTVPFFSAALARVQPSETGSAASLLNSVQQLGGTLGIATLGTIAATLAPAVAGTAVALAGTVVLALVLFLSARSMLTVDSRRVGERDVR